MFRRAIVRPPAGNFADGLTTAELGKPDPARALYQHEAYCRALESSKLELIRLPPDLDHPDSTFVEDTAVLTRRSAIVTRPGAASRVTEVAATRDAIRPFYREVYEIHSPGTLDGGDVCQAGSHFFIGVSHRTNEEGARQLCEFLLADGFTSSVVDIRGCRSILHLKSGISYLHDNDLVVTQELADREEFEAFNLIPVPAEESYACNCLLVNQRVLVAAGFPRVASQLAGRGYQPFPLDMSEFRKMDGGLSCLSLRF